MQDQTLAQLAQEWRFTGRGLDARHAAELITRRHPDLLAGCVDLASLLTRLEGLGGDRFEVLASMLELGAEHPLLRRALLQVLAPGLPGVARRIGWGAPTFTRPECMAELVAIAWELTGRWAGQRRRYCVPDLLSATRLQAMRRVRAMRPGDARLDAEHVAWAIEPEEREWHLDFSDLTARLPRPTAAALYAQAVLGMGAAEAAEQLGVSARTVQRWNRAVATGLLDPTAVA